MFQRINERGSMSSVPHSPHSAVATETSAGQGHLNSGHLWAWIFHLLFFFFLLFFKKGLTKCSM